jgi:hypothetical protein
MLVIFIASQRSHDLAELIVRRLGRYVGAMAGFTWFFPLRSARDTFP